MVSDGGRRGARSRLRANRKRESRLLRRPASQATASGPNSVVALHAKTGAFAWGFQLVHHDLWDYDTASPPLLASIPHDGKSVPVVIQGNKTGFLYVLNRDTGIPVFPVEERSVPASDVSGEAASPTQPIPIAPPAGDTPEAHRRRGLGPHAC